MMRKERTFIVRVEGEDWKQYSGSLHLKCLDFLFENFDKSKLHVITQPQNPSNPNPTHPNPIPTPIFPFPHHDNKFYN